MQSNIFTLITFFLFFSLPLTGAWNHRLTKKSLKVDFIKIGILPDKKCGIRN